MLEKKDLLMKIRQLPRRDAVISGFLLLSVFSCTAERPQTASQSASPVSETTAPVQTASPLPETNNSAPPPVSPTVNPSAPGSLTIENIRPVIARRCSVCHGFSGGVYLDTDAKIRFNAARIKQKVVIEKSMPFNNFTEITQEERDMIGRWIDAGTP
jgi:uncharacterized membrane protein